MDKEREKKNEQLIRLTREVYSGRRKGDRLKCLHKKVKIPVYIKSVFSYKGILLGGVVFRNYFARADDVHYTGNSLG